MNFEVIAEVEPPTAPGRARMHEQVRALNSISSHLLVPDNHTGRATVSSLVIASQLQATGASVIACLNARDRNLLGLRRDILTARHLGVEDVLLVRGDDPTVGQRSGPLLVRTMLDECDDAGLRCSVTTRLQPLPTWKKKASRLFVQISWSIDDLLTWRSKTSYAGSVFAGVMVLPSAQVARRIGARVPELRPPAHVVDAVERDPSAGRRIAIELIEALRHSGAFDGVHLVGGSRLDPWGSTIHRLPSASSRA